MTNFGEKMRQLSAQLKSAIDSFKQTAQLRVREAAHAGRKLWRWPGERLAARKVSGSTIAEKVWQNDETEERRANQDIALHQPRSSWRKRHPKLTEMLRIAAIILSALFLLPYLLIPIYCFVDPPISALMLRNGLLGKEVNYQWVNFGDISPNLATAVVIAEDARFCSHWGVDWLAVGDVLEDLEDGETPRGASTIPMQTAKNLFLWPEQTYLRKTLEVPLAYFMTLLWPKQRILEVYLNIAEWGPGIYGAEAAARFHFRTSAASLNPAQAALLVAALPNPLKRNAGRPGPQTRRLANRIQFRVRREAQDASCIFNR
jgi:monofunctional biosynthetic peptidoglycan transglycosylase